MRAKSLRIDTKGYGNFLGCRRGTFYIRDRDRKITEISHYEHPIKECILRDGNYVSVDALTDLAYQSFLTPELPKM